MDAFHRFAFFTTARDASFVALAAATLMLAFSFEPALACFVGGNVALIFTLGLLLRVACLSDERIVRTEVWRILTPQERPVDETERRQARDDFQELLLRFAKAAAGIAVALFGSALTLSLSKLPRSLHAAAEPGDWMHRLEMVW
jgi:hypothetical protein